MSELKKQALIEQTVITTLRELGVIPEMITRKEMIKRFGSTKRIDQALTQGEIPFVRGDGKNSTIKCRLTDYRRWVERITESPTIF